MNTQTPFNLPTGHFAQPAVASNSLVINGQNLIDAFADCDMEQCDKLASLLASGRHEQVGRMLEAIFYKWAK